MSLLQEEAKLIAGKLQHHLLTDIQPFIYVFLCLALLLFHIQAQSSQPNYLECLVIEVCSKLSCIFELRKDVTTFPIFSAISSSPFWDKYANRSFAT